MSSEVIDIAVAREVKKVVDGRVLPALINPASLTIVHADDGSLIVGVEAYEPAEKKWVQVAWPVTASASEAIALGVIRGRAANAPPIAPASTAESASPATEQSRSDRREPTWRLCRAGRDGRPCVPREEGGCRRRAGHRGDHRGVDGSEWLTAPSSAALLVGSEAISGERRSGGQDQDQGPSQDLSSSIADRLKSVPNCDR